jgi:magnesium transporter
MAARKRSSRAPRRPSPGAPPGTIVAAGARRETPVRVMQYTPERFEEALVSNLEECRSWLERPGFVWFDIDDTPDAELLEFFGNLLGLHPLAVADVANVPQRPKHETYEGFDFVVLRMIAPPKPGAMMEPEQLSLFLGDRWVVTFQERPGDCFEAVRARLRAGTGNLRAYGADYLAYAIIDAVVDQYFPVVEALGDRLEQVEDTILSSANMPVMSQLHGTRREFITLRRAIWPLRELLGQATREGVGLFTSRTRVYLRDCYDHSVQLIDLVENYRELSSSLMELHLAAVGFRTNEVMKVLTIISTIFLPLTFIAGVYGMNFDTAHEWNMPELRWRFGYAFSLLLMAASAIGMLLFFRRKGWLGRRRDLGEPD